MDVDQHPQSRKRGRNAVLDVTNGGDGRLTLQTVDVQPVEYDDDDGDGGGGKVVDDGAGLVAWQHSSRIYRVSRATGGKDRHSKVLTSKGLRDRRVRLSVSTAIQFYDLQDRLGYDQPSKAVEWLIKKASDAISELPSLKPSAFPPPTPKQASDEKRPEPEPEPEQADIHSFMGAAFSNQHLTGSACSSTSETSKGSALSLSRSANRVKARERARERAAKEKEKEAPKESDHGHVFPNQQSINNPSTSFTQLLTGGGASSPTSSPFFALPPQNQNADHLIFAKHFRHMYSAMDYLGGQQPPVPAFFSNFGNSTATTTTSPPLNGLPLNICTSSGGGSNVHPDQHLQQFSFAAATGTEHHHHHMQVPAGGGNEYNLNFSISSSLTGYNRGTLQSNATPSLSHHYHHHHHQQQQQLHKFVSSMDGQPAVPFFVMSPGGTESNQFSAGLDGRLQLYHGDRHSDLKGKGKS